MSKENAKAFYEKVKGDQGLQRKIGELAGGKPDQTESIIIKVAGENGFQFSLEEMRAVIADIAPKPGELNDAQLESVAGGKSSIFTAVSVFTMGGCYAVSAIGEKQYDQSCKNL